MPDQGTFAEYICTPWTAICPKPEHLSWEQAAARTTGRVDCLAGRGHPS